MRRTLILLALSLAAVGGSRTADAAPPATGAHALAAVDGTTAAAFLRSAGGTLSLAWQEGSGPAPRPLSRRVRTRPSLDRLLESPSSRGPAFRALSGQCRGYAAPLALSRAGRTSCNTTTPPPSRVVV